MPRFTIPKKPPYEGGGRDFDYDEDSDFDFDPPMRDLDLEGAMAMFGGGGSDFDFDSVMPLPGSNVINGDDGAVVFPAPPVMTAISTAPPQAVPPNLPATPVMTAISTAPPQMMPPNSADGAVTFPVHMMGAMMAQELRF